MKNYSLFIMDYYIFDFITSIHFVFMTFSDKIKNCISISSEEYLEFQKLETY